MNRVISLVNSQKRIFQYHTRFLARFCVIRKVVSNSSYTVWLLTFFCISVSNTVNCTACSLYKSFAAGHVALTSHRLRSSDSGTDWLSKVLACKFPLPFFLKFFFEQNYLSLIMHVYWMIYLLFPPICSLCNTKNINTPTSCDTNPNH